MRLIESSFSANQVDASSFKVELKEIKKEGKVYTWVIHVKCISDEYKVYHVHKPDGVGIAGFQTQYKGLIVHSVDPLVVPPIEYKGVIFKTGDEFKFKFKSEVRNGSLVFLGSEKVLPIYENKAKVRMSLRLWVSDFNSKTSRIEDVNSEWVDLSFPFKLSPPPQKKEGRGVRKLLPE